MTVTATLAEARINSRNENGGTLRDRLEDLRGKLEEVVTLVTNSKEQINQAKDKSVDAKAEVDNAKEVIERARDSLKTAKRILEDEGRDALRLAEERSKKFGAESERMSAIAREARRLAEQWVLIKFVIVLDGWWRSTAPLCTAYYWAVPRHDLS